MRWVSTIRHLLRGTTEQPLRGRLSNAAENEQLLLKRPSWRVNYN
jgi:hypothetical protein